MSMGQEVIERERLYHRLKKNFLYDLDVIPGLLDLYLDILLDAINVVRLTLSSIYCAI